MNNQSNPITAKYVRFIKLGRGGKWEQECIEKGIARLGFSTQENFHLCSSSQWNEYVSFWEERKKTPSVATNYTNQIKSFFEDKGETLWITFYKRQMWWAFLDSSPAAIHWDNEGTYRTTKSGWKSTDICGHTLFMHTLSGRITKVAGFQGTICEIKEAKYILRKINTELPPETLKGQEIYNEMIASVKEMMRLLTPKDFELLVDLIFSTSGWRRLSIIGGNEKTIDSEIVLPTTNEQAFIQIKSKTNQKEFDEYYKEFDGKACDRMFYAYHSLSGSDIKCDDNKVSIIDPDKLSKMVIDTGLIAWLIDKAS